MKDSKKSVATTIVSLHIMIMIYSLSGVFSKKAAQVPFMSVSFFLYYGAILFLLAFYAVGWQQIIKRLPLSIAFSNKAITLFWGLIWGVIFFGEEITPGKVVGIIIVIVGVVLYSVATQENEVK